MRNNVLALFALVAVVVLGGAGAEAGPATTGKLAKPPNCAQVPDTNFQAAAINMLTLCPVSKEDSCPDECVSALTTLEYKCSMAMAVAHASAQPKDVGAAVHAIQAIWEQCMPNQEMMLSKSMTPPVLRRRGRMLAESPSGSAGKVGFTRTRLVGGPSPASGTLEVYAPTVGWFTVCYSKIKEQAAQVACRSLGYSGGQLAEQNTFPKVSDNAKLFEGYFFCDGTESDLNKCSIDFNGLGYGKKCSHDEDVGIICENAPTPVPTPTTPTPAMPTPTTPTTTTTAVPSPPSSSSSSTSSGGSSVSIGAIVGGVVGGVLIIAAIAGSWCYVERQKARKVALSPTDKLLDGAGHFPPPPPNDPEAPIDRSPLGGSSDDSASAEGTVGAIAVACAGAGGAAALAGTEAVAGAGMQSEDKQAAPKPSVVPAVALKDMPHNNLQDTFISGTPLPSAPKETPRSVLQDTFISPPRPAAPLKEATNGSVQDTLITPAFMPDGAEVPLLATEGQAEQQDAPAAKEALHQAPEAAIPTEVATTSTSTAALPETPSGPQTRSPVQSLSSRSTRSSSTSNKLASQDALLSYIAKQRTLPAVAPDSAMQPRGSSGVNVAPWEVSYDQLVMTELIGEGSFGRVYMADFHSTTVAVKVLIDKEAMAHAGPREALSLPGSLMGKLDEEASLLASLRHPCVVQFMGVCRAPPCIITEYCPKGNLTSVLMAAKRDTALSAELTWRRRLSMALDAARGMLYLHARSPPIIHRDLKSPNLLVDDSYHCKVSDFNLSRFVEENLGTKSSSMAGLNPRWLAPEVMKGGRATPAADTYSFGIVMWELLTWELPWSTTLPWELYNVLMNGGHPEIPPREELPGADTTSFEGLDSYMQLMKRCWAQNQYDRPGFEEIIRDLRSLLDSTA